jgi:hypothetical protein
MARDKLIESLATLTITIALMAAGALVASPSRAADDDHLQCYKIRDPHAYKGIINLDSEQFGVTPGCKIKIKGAKFCAPTQKAVISIDPETPVTDLVAEDLRFDRICYRVKCPSSVIAPQEVTDQFGTRTVDVLKLLEVCTPAVKGSNPPPECGNAIVEPGEECESSLDCDGGAGCGAGCTCVCGALDPQCPDVLELTALAGTGSETTATEEDLGWTGIAHDTDVLDRARVDLAIVCGGSGPSSCGPCEIQGVDPDLGNCRCANLNRVTCDQPFLADGDDCAGAVCECYTAPPTPRSNGNVPTCLVTRLAGEPSGDWNPDTGAGSVALDQRRTVYLGSTLVTPCPTCDGDATPNDGLRDGTCVGGADDTLSCDANASDATFPAPGGGEYSYDCFPGPGLNITGPGLAIDLTLSTGSDSLTGSVVCGFPPTITLDCHCGQCSGDASKPCSSDGDCAGVGTCERDGAGQPLPNPCDDGTCTDAGGGEGTCAAGPTDRLCDGIVRANGRGIIACQTNADCDPMNVGVDAGDCTLTEQRECFLPAIVSQGAADPAQPVAAGVACAPKSSNAAVNVVAGLPGPLRLRLETETVFRCAGNPAFTYPSCP